MKVCDAAVAVLTETDNPAVVRGDEHLLHLIADRLGWEHHARETSRRVLRALARTPGPLRKGFVNRHGTRPVLIFRLPHETS